MLSFAVFIRPDASGSTAGDDLALEFGHLCECWECGTLIQSF